MISEGLLVRHFRGASGGRDAAVLDIAQDHLLWHLHHQGAFDAGLTFKGGTALRKYRAGNDGRFSTDLDFTAPDDDVALTVLDHVDGASVEGFTFEVRELGDDGRRANLIVDTPFGRPNLGAKIELSRHPLTLLPDLLTPVPLPIHRGYDIDLPAVPVVQVEEAIAEKLARYRRVSLARDLYDLQWFATQGAMDTDRIRRLWVLKVYRDVVRDGRGDKPLDPQQVLHDRRPEQFENEDIGYLTRPVRIADWTATVQQRYAFLTHMTDDETRWATCNPRHQHEVDEALREL